MKKQYDIVGLTLSTLDHSAFSQLLQESKEAIQVYIKANKQDSLYTKKLTEMDELMGQFNNLLHKGRFSKHSQALLQADADRDAAFATFRNLVKAFSRVKEESTKASYQRLRDLLKNYKGLEDLTYERESEHINHLLATLKNESYQADLTRLHLTAHVTALTNAQKAFDKVYKDRLAEHEAHVPNHTRKIRSQLQAIYDGLVDYTAVTAFLQPELVATKKLHTSLNAIRTRYRSYQGGKKKGIADEAVNKPAQPAEVSTEADVVKEA